MIIIWWNKEHKQIKWFTVILDYQEITTEPAHEIMVLFVIRKLFLQTCMRSHPVGLDVWFLVRPFVCFHTSCVRTVKALARLCKCAGSPEPSLVAYMISTIISWAGSIKLPHDKTNKVACATSEDSDQPGLIWVFARCTVILLVLS